MADEEEVELKPIDVNNHIGTGIPNLVLQYVKALNQELQPHHAHVLIMFVCNHTPKGHAVSGVSSTENFLEIKTNIERIMLYCAAMLAQMQAEEPDGARQRTDSGSKRTKPD